MTTYTATVIDDPADPTFNQLLSINDEEQIGGYFGSGATGHPNKGYITNTAGKVFYNENYPFSAQTQVTGINDLGWTVGFEIDAAGNSLGFIDIFGTYTLCQDPLAPTVGGVLSEQFLSVNDHGVAVGFYTKANGDTAGFEYFEGTNTYVAVVVGAATNVTAAGIDQKGDVCGFNNDASGGTVGFIHLAGGTTKFIPGLSGWTTVQALGINDAGIVVGSYVKAGNTFGFTYNVNSNTYQSFSYGNGTDTVLNGINDKGEIVGFYVGANGDTNGLYLRPPAPTFNWTFTTLDDPADPTFNQLLSINNAGIIAGYFGSGAAGHPNQGYLLTNNTTYTNLNFPSSVQTQETGINNSNATVGFEIDPAGDNLGFYQHGGAFQLVLDPSAPKIGGVVSEQLLGLNDRDEMAGFYVKDGKGDDAGFTYNEKTGVFQNVAISGATSVTATDINDDGWISGFYTNGAGKVQGFLDIGGAITTIAGTLGDTNIQALGLNNNNLEVGSFMDTAGNTEGFVYQMASHSFNPVAAPLGAEGTVLNGVNDRNQIVGFYTDSSGLTHGLLLATPGS